MSPRTFSAVAGWSKTTAADDAEPTSALAKVAERARPPMERVRPAASAPAHRSNGLSPAAGASDGAGLVMVNPVGRSAWASTARWARAAGAPPFEAEADAAGAWP